MKRIIATILYMLAAVFAWAFCGIDYVGRKFPEIKKATRQRPWLSASNRGVAFERRER